MQSILYAITEKRVLIVIGSISYKGNTSQGQITSIAPINLREREIKIRKDGSGDLVFPSAKSKDKVGFYGIPEVRNVDSLIAQTFE